MADERVEILNEAIRLTTQDRNQQYGSFVDNMQAYGELKEWYRKWAKDKYTIAHDASIDMALAKISRIAVGSFHTDNYIDAPNYIAAAYEAEYHKQGQAIGELQDGLVLTSLPQPVDSSMAGQMGMVLK